MQELSVGAIYLAVDLNAGIIQLIDRILWNELFKNKVAKKDKIWKF